MRLAIAALVLAGCSLHIDNGQLTCAQNGGRCPRGFHCAADATCWRDGQDPPITGDDGFVSPTRPNGAACDQNLDCQSQVCTGPGGVCCDRACDGVCETCAADGAVGQCTFVTGQPTGGRSCGGDTAGDCVGMCNGASTACAFPSISQVCGPSCTGKCDGQGRCSDGAGQGCAGGFACGPGACRTSCTDSTQCQPHFTCNTTTQLCVRDNESDCFDGLDNNGDGLIDCADPTCSPGRAICVPAPGGSTSYGVLAPGACPAGYAGATTALHQGLSAGMCSGCSCNTVGDCAYALEFYTDTKFCDTTPVPAVSLRIGYPGRCAQVMNTPAPDLGSGGMRSVKIGVDSGLTLTCQQVTGAGPVPPASWAHDATFCGLSGGSPMGCPTGQLCVPHTACAKLQGGVSCGGQFGNIDPTSIDSNGKYFTSVADTRSCSCGTCTPSNGGNGNQCPGLGATLPAVLGFAANDVACAAPSGLLSNATVGNCVPYDGTANYWAGTFGYASTTTPNKVPGTTCTEPTITSGAATPANPFTVCCQ